MSSAATDANSAAAAAHPAPRPRLAWLTPTVCRLILAVLIVGGFALHVGYLHGPPPIDLSGDEAHYWDWSRQLDWSYYSKGPLVALIIRASTELFGNTMPAVRYPALVFAAATTLLTYWLTRKLFQSDRIALGAVGLTHIVPMFVAGSVLMTIDPPFFLSWAAATCLAVKALWDNRRWPWLLIGLAIGIGFLAKYSAPLWYVGLAVFMLVDRPSRKWLATPWPYLALLVTALMTLPVLAWNIGNDWVSYKHVATSVAGRSFKWQAPLEFVGAQFLVVGPLLMVIMIAATTAALRGRFAGPATDVATAGADSPAEVARDARFARAARFLATIGVAFYVFVLLALFRSKPQPNWPAPAYFTLIVLTAGFIAQLAADPPRWRRWRGLVYASIAFGVVLAPVAHDTIRIYPLVAAVDRWRSPDGPPRNAKEFDPTARLMGHAEMGRLVTEQLQLLGEGAFVLCDDYQSAALMAFYVDGQPRTYYAASYFTRPTERGRFSQYDLWRDRSLEPSHTALLGRDAVYVGYLPEEKDIQRAFERVERLEPILIMRGGLRVASLKMTRCYNFKGMSRPIDGQSRN